MMPSQSYRKILKNSAVLKENSKILCFFLFNLAQFHWIAINKPLRYSFANIFFHVRKMPIKPSKIIDSFLNPAPSRDYVVHIQIPEFTCLCPLTGQPDFAKLILGYIPDERCIELKSLKMYIWSFRNEGAFHEAVTNQIVDDLVKAINPRYLKLTAKFYVRGGLFTNVVAEHRKDGWIARPAINLENFSQAHSTVDSEE